MDVRAVASPTTAPSTAHRVSDGAEDAETRDEALSRVPEPVRHKPATSCPACHHPVPLGASDFCDRPTCQAHLYPGHCIFCLAEVLESFAQCPSCGNSPTGIRCPYCQTWSRTDFCPHCQAALTARAVGAVESLRSDPQAQETFVVLGGLDGLFSQAMAGTLPDDVVAALSEVPAVDLPPVSHTPAVAPGPDWAGSVGPTSSPAPTRQVAVSPEPDTLPSASPATPMSAPLVAALRSAATRAPDIGRFLSKVRSVAAGAADREALREAASAAMAASTDALLARTYPTAQEARLTRDAVQYELRLMQVTRTVTATGWRCNAYGCLHPMPGGPSVCGNPSLGGTTVFEEVDTMRVAATRSGVA